MFKTIKNILFHLFEFLVKYSFLMGMYGLSLLICYKLFAGTTIVNFVLYSFSCFFCALISAYVFFFLETVLDYLREIKINLKMQNYLNGIIDKDQFLIKDFLNQTEENHENK